MWAQKERGYTLVELVIVVTILAVIAAIAVPASSSNDDEQLELAAQEFTAALRFGRSEAIRTGKPHGAHVQATSNRVRVFRLDTDTSPATLVYDVYHPIDKSLYDIDFNLTSVAALDSMDHTIVYRGTCDQRNRIYFDPNGTPWCSSPDTVLLQDYELRMSLGTHQRLITLDAITGRVTVQ